MRATVLFTRRGVRPLALALAFFATSLAAPAQPPAPAANTPTPAAIFTARDGDDLYFVAEFERPADMARPSVDYQPWEQANVPWPIVAELRADPFRLARCYAEEFRGESGARSVSPVLSFVGRCAPRDTLAVVYRYPLVESGATGRRRDARLPSGEWREASITLDFRTARPLDTSKEPARTRWARAQAGFFDEIDRHTVSASGFFSFARLQTERKYGLSKTDSPTRPRRDQFSAPTNERLYELMTGSLAVQESLQLDRMTGAARDDQPMDVPIADIRGVEVRSHPFDQMRAGRAPRHSRLAELVPEDFYYARFETVGKALDLLAFADEWGGSLLRLASPTGRDLGVIPRILEQWALDRPTLESIAKSPAASEIALAGSDPYFADGADVSLLFRVSDRAAFEAIVGPAWQRAAGDARAAQSSYEGVSIEQLTAAPRRVNACRFWLDDVCVYSNSLAAAQALISAAKGKRPSMAGAADFQYMRAAVYPLDDAQEDGFVFLSDAFIRRLVGPELRIKQQRRLEAAGSLRMIANAALLYGYENGPGEVSLARLIEREYLSGADLFDPQAGEFSWDSATVAATNTVWGRAGNLTPLIEIPADRATAKEKQDYEAFRDRYTQYWRRYFDPIGVRLRIERTIRAEVCILPLIDMSAYEEFEDVAGGPPVEFRVDQFAPTTLLRFAAKFNDGRAKAQVQTGLAMFTKTNVSSDWLGDWYTFWVEDTDAFRKIVERAYAVTPEGPDDWRNEVLDVFNASFVLGVGVKNKLSLAAMLVGLRAFVEQAAPNTVVFNNLPNYRGVSIVQIAPDPSGMLAAELRSPDAGAPPPASAAAPGGAETSQPAIRETPPAIYYATIGDGFYLATQASALRNLIDQLATPADTAPRSYSANMLLYAAPGAAEKIRPTVSFLLEQQARRVSLANLAEVWLLGQSGALDGRSLDEAAERFLGYRIVCPDGGGYSFDAARGESRSTIHGTLAQPHKLDAPPPGSPLTPLLDALSTLTGHLRFTDDGLATTIEIERR